MGIRFWCFQLLPPLSMLGVLFATDSSTSLVFLTGLYVLPVLFSLISICAKLFNLRKRKYYLIRPSLTIAIFVLIITIAQWSYNMALEQAIDEARLIHQLCNKELLCPENPKGWKEKKMKVGFWLKYVAIYYPNADSFKIHVYQGPDLGDDITGGTNSPFKVSHYVD